MSAPVLLFFDTDVLIQLFISECLTPLRVLRAQYGLRPVIVGEVEIELTRHQKFGERFAADTRKAISNGTIEIFAESAYRALLANGALPAAAGRAYESIQRDGQRYGRRVGSGEAYTLATAAALNQPAACNDGKALIVLNGREPLPTPVLRTFDLVAFGHTSDSMTLKDCEQVRKVLLDAGEGIAKEFTHASFSTGFQSFQQRLVVDASRSHVRARQPPYASILHLVRS